MSYNNNSFNGSPHGPTLNGLVKSGADLLKQMYDVKIFFPGSDGPETDSAFDYPITVRCSGFTVPEVAVGTYDIKYHGISVKRPNGNMEGDRTIELTFREDAAFQLRQRFTTWMMAVGDPVTGGVSNSINYFGALEVATITGEYTSVSMVTPTGTDKSDPKQILNSRGELTTANAANPIATWRFYHVWVSKVGGVEFSTDAGEANTFPVTFQYQDCDMPFFGGNKLASEASTWSQNL